jgi:hypothetical protein
MSGQSGDTQCDLNALLRTQVARLEQSRTTTVRRSCEPRMAPTMLLAHVKYWYTAFSSLSLEKKGRTGFDTTQGFLRAH